jgi:hypothetical protein
VVALGDAGDDREQDLDLGFGEMAQGPGDDSVLVVVRAKARLLEEWLEFDLVDGRHDVAHLGEAVEVLWLEARDSDAAQQAFALQVDATRRSNVGSQACSRSLALMPRCFRCAPALRRAPARLLWGLERGRGQDRALRGLAGGDCDRLPVVVDRELLAHRRARPRPSAG